MQRLVLVLGGKLIDIIVYLSSRRLCDPVQEFVELCTPRTAGELNASMVGYTLFSAAVINA